MKKILTNNWGLKLLSFFLAFVLWFLVVLLNDPMDTTTFSNIKVKLTNTELLEEENKVYEVLDNTDTVRVTVRAPRSVIDKLSATDIVAEADVSKLTDINTVAIEYVVLNTEVDCTVEGNHEAVRLNVEEKASRYVNLISNVKGSAAEGFIVGSVVLDQNMIEISGPKSVVESVGYAGADISVSGASNNLSANVDIHLYDKEGSLITQENIKKQADYAHIEVEILASKSVPVEINYLGEPARGYMLTGQVESNPATVKVAGAVGNLANFNKIVIPKERLNISGTEESIIETVNIKDYLPEDVRLADASAGNIKVTIHVEPIVEKTLDIPGKNLNIINVPEDFRAKLLSEQNTYALEVRGLGASINTLKAGNMKLTLDIAKWMEDNGISMLREGTYSITANVDLAEDVVVSNPVVVSVVITEEEE